MPELKQLLIFHAVVEHGSFSRASVVLSIGQPVLSRQIKALEAEYNTPLLYRNGRGVVPTEAGKRLDDYATAILEQLQRAESDIAAMSASPRGSITIGMPPSVGVLLTAPLVQHFQANFPDVSLRVIEGFSGHVLEWLVMGKIDVGVLYNAPRMSNLLSSPLLKDELYLLGASDDPHCLEAGPVDAARLAELPMILPPRPHGLRLLLDQVLAGAGITPRIDFEVESMPSTLQLVQKRLGYTILSYASVHRFVAEGRIRYWPLRNPSIQRELILSTSNQRPMTSAIKELAAQVKKEARRLQAEGVWEPAKPLPKLVV